MIRIENGSYLINREEMKKFYKPGENKFRNRAYNILFNLDDEKLTKQVEDHERKYAIRDAYVIKPEESEDELNSPNIYNDYVDLKNILITLKQIILENAYTLVDEYGEITEEKVR